VTQQGINPRRTWQWRVTRNRFKDECRARKALCHLCVARGDVENAVIDYNAKPLQPNGFEADHVLPVSTHPHLAYFWGNLRASHSRCNRQRRGEALKAPVAHGKWIKPNW
jgi:hypothetical protein